MTTIIATRECMVADGLGILDNSMVYATNMIKLFTVNGFIIGGSGTAHEFLKIINLIKESDENPLDTLSNLNYYNDRYTLLLLNEKYGLWRYEGQGDPYELYTEYASIGTGWQIATSAIKAGATPQRAVEIAAEMDTYTGGTIITHYVSDITSSCKNRSGKRAIVAPSPWLKVNNIKTRVTKWLEWG